MDDNKNLDLKITSSQKESFADCSHADPQPLEDISRIHQNQTTDEPLK